MIVGSVAVLLLMSIATVNAFMRLPFIKATWRGAYETVGFLGAIVIAFALGYTQKRKDHIVVDILTEKFPKRVNRILDGINYFITTIFLCHCFLAGIRLGDEDIEIRGGLGNLKNHISPLYI